jgi:serine/threonine protein kinase
LNSKPDPHQKEIKTQLFDLYDESFTSNPDEQIIHPLFSQLKKIDQDYDVLDIISKGGMKTIYKAIHLKSQRKVAMAKLHDGTPEELYDPFIREARLTALMDHPNIIKVYDLGVDEHNRPFFTMDLKTGDTLEELLMKKETDLAQRLNLFLKVCDAIAYAHSKHILHLDIKPSNIQVGSYGELLVCDWGLGRILDDDLDEIHNELLHPDLLNHMTLGSEIKGTPGYMAPEQIQGTEKTTATDIYSLGVLLRTMISQAPPEGDDTDVLLKNTLEGNWDDTSTIYPECPKMLNSIVRKAMSVSPQQRYKNALTLRNDVEKVLHHFSPSTEHGQLIQEIVLFYKRHALICKTSIIFILCISLLSLYFTRKLKISRDHAISQKEQAQLHAQKAINLSNKLELEKAQVKAISLDLIDTQIKKTAQYSDYIIFDNPISAVELGLKTLDKIHRLSSEQGWAFMQKGYLNFIKLDFALALENFAMNDEKASDLHDLSKLYLNKFPEVNRPNSLLIISQLMDDFIAGNKRTPLLDKIISYNIAKYGYRKEMGQVVKKFIQFLNPEWTPLFKYNYDRQHLTIGNNLDLLSVRESGHHQSILRYIPVKQLKITSSDFKGLNQLKGLNYLEVLDLRELNQISLQSLPPLPLLNTILLDPDHNYYDLNNLPKELKISYSLPKFIEEE